MIIYKNELMIKKDIKTPFVYLSLQQWDPDLVLKELPWQPYNF